MLLFQSCGPTDRADGDRGHAQGNEQVAADFLVRADADAVFRHAGDVLSEREVQCGECVGGVQVQPDHTGQLGAEVQVVDAPHDVVHIHPQ